MKKVADVLRHKFFQFTSIGANWAIYDALHQMHFEGVDYLVIMEDDRFCGILSEHGLAQKMAFRKDLDRAQVHEFSTQYLPVAAPTDSLHHCLRLMDQYNVRHLAVYDHFQFKGIVCCYDLMKQLLEGSTTPFSDVWGKQQPFIE